MAAMTTFFFGEGFLRDHAGSILEDPRIAIMELVANSYDAGATEVRITLPPEKGGELAIADNGTGMTADEFERRWRQFSYNRTKEQGEIVVFPPGVKGVSRRAFGRNGKGRHAAHAFGRTYTVSTWRGGTVTVATVEYRGEPERPFDVKYGPSAQRPDSGTEIRVTVEQNLLTAQEVHDLVGSKFVVDPSFRVLINGTLVELMNLSGVNEETLSVKDVGEVHLLHVGAGGPADRATTLRGITWWVNQRMVGEPSWEGLEGEGAYLDGRRSEAKKHSFIIKADILKDSVKADWSGLHASKPVNAVKEAVHGAVVRRLSTLLASRRKERKADALKQNRALLKDLAPDARSVVGKFVDDVIETCTSISEKDLGRLVLVLAKMEKARTGYDLLGRLAQCSPDDLDTWNALISTWTADNARLALGELDHRLRVITELEALAHSAKADELHDLQPVFERGLWMFGPEYEAIDFRSNRTLATVVRDFFGGLLNGETLPASKRPDLVALPNASIGFYGADSYDQAGEIIGVRKVLIVELKRGAFNVTQKEVDQARDYSIEIRKSHHVQPSTVIHAYVMGATLDTHLQVNKVGVNNETLIEPMTYATLIRRAKARTFNLHDRLKATVGTGVLDPDVEDVLSQPVQELIPF